MNTEQHEHRIQEIIRAVCKNNGVRLVCEINDMEPRNPALSVTHHYDCDWYRRMTLYILLAGISVNTFGALVATLMTASSWLVYAAAGFHTALACAFILVLRSKPISHDELLLKIHAALLDAGYVMEWVNGRMRTGWCDRDFHHE